MSKEKERISYPVDSASFRWIRERGFLYVDKSRYIPLLTDAGKYYFLARPRRFGKSLFLDMLSEFFQGNRQLFTGLSIDSDPMVKWETYPVIRLNLSGVSYTAEESLEDSLSAFLSRYEREYRIETTEENVYVRFQQLIQGVATKSGKGVVMLVDEYDAPLSSTVDRPELQELFREQLQGFYSVLKKEEHDIHFCLMSGVTRFGKVSVFSGLNNLNDISFDNEFAGICGVTNEELHRYYDPGVEVLAGESGCSKEDIYSKLKYYYDGYHFSKSLEDIYNPYSINYVFRKGEFQDYWCRSGVPSLLAKTLMNNDFDVEKLNGSKVSVSALSDLSMFTGDPVPLFFQTGYLTIKAYEERRQLYTLGYPNREVESGILHDILKVYMPGNVNKQLTIYEMVDALEAGEPERFITVLSSFLNDIPSQLHKYVDRYENYYHTIFYCLAVLIGMETEAEYNTSEGFVDMVIKTHKYIYVIELKVNGTADDAISQIQEKHYLRPFESDSRSKIAVGIGFSKKTHTIESYLILKQ